MPIITQSISNDYLDAYDGYDQQQVGLGLIEPNIYATQQYQKKKIQNMALGLITEARYAGFEHDPNPKILTIAYEPSYSTVIGYNLNYGTPKLRQAMLKFVLESNAARIKSNLPIMIDYHAMKRAIPDSQWLVRRYKVVGIAVKETFQLREWPELVGKKTPFDGFYMNYKSGNKK